MTQILERDSRGIIGGKSAGVASEKTTISELPNTFFNEAVEGFSEYFPDPDLFTLGVKEALGERHSSFPEGLVRYLFAKINREARLHAKTNPYNDITEEGRFSPLKALEGKKGPELVKLLVTVQDMKNEGITELRSLTSGRMVVRLLHQMQNPNSIK